MGHLYPAGGDGVLLVLGLVVTPLGSH